MHFDQPQPTPVAAPVYQTPQTPHAQPQPVPQTGYSTETTMTQQAGQEVVQSVTLNLNAESIKILSEASSIYGESIVNFGIKLFSKTNAYKEFMLKADFKSMDQSSEDIQTLADVTAVPDAGSAPAMTNNQPSASSASPAAPAVGGGFNAW